MSAIDIVDCCNREVVLVQCWDACTSWLETGTCKMPVWDLAGVEPEVSITEFYFMP